MLAQAILQLVGKDVDGVILKLVGENASKVVLKLAGEGVGTVLFEPIGEDVGKVTFSRQDHSKSKKVLSPSSLERRGSPCTSIVLVDAGPFLALRA